MEFSEVVRRRRMVRNFTDKPVETETIHEIMDLARRGPSAGYTQGQSFIVIVEQRVKEAVAEICGERYYVEKGFDPFISKAPVLIVPCTSEEAYHKRHQEKDKIDSDGKEINWPIPFWFMDIGCAVMVVLLSAVDHGLAAGFAGIWDLDGIRGLLDVPDQVTPVGVIPIGHPARDKRSPSLKRGRKPVGEVVHWDRWGGLAESGTL